MIERVVEDHTADAVARLEQIDDRREPGARHHRDHAGVGGELGEQRRRRVRELAGEVRDDQRGLQLARAELGERCVQVDRSARGAQRDGELLPERLVRGNDHDPARHHRAPRVTKITGRYTTVPS